MTLIFDIKAKQFLEIKNIELYKKEEIQYFFASNPLNNAIKTLLEELPVSKQPQKYFIENWCGFGENPYIFNGPEKATKDQIKKWVDLKIGFVNYKESEHLQFIATFNVENLGATEAKTKKVKIKKAFIVELVKNNISLPGWLTVVTDKKASYFVFPTTKEGEYVTFINEAKKIKQTGCIPDNLRM